MWAWSFERDERAGDVLVSFLVEVWLVEDWALGSGRVELVGEMIGNESEMAGGINNGISPCNRTHQDM